MAATPETAYRAHRRYAEKRGISFELTFEQWWQLWQPHWAERGRRVGQKNMCRTGDVGPYAIGNVRIDTVTANQHERALVFRTATAHRNLTRRFRETGQRCTGDISWLVRDAFAPYDEEGDSAV